jgi:hypothetical protein
VSLPVYRNLSLPYRERKKGPSRVHQPKEKKRIFSSLLVSVSLLFFYKKRVKSIRKKKKGGGTFKEGRRQNGRDKETVHKQEQHSPKK